MIFECIANAWSPKIGDPYPLGWITLVSYFIAAILTYSVSRRTGRFYTKKASARVFWLGLTLLMVFLGLNKQLDLQAFLKDVAKCQAIFEGWYDDRREVQFVFLIVTGVAFSFVLIFIIGFFRENLIKDKLAIIGLSFLLVFIFVHASYFNYLNARAINTFYETGMNRILELTGILFICLQSMKRLRN